MDCDKCEWSSKVNGKALLCLFPRCIKGEEVQKKNTITIQKKSSFGTSEIRSMVCVGTSRRRCE